MKKKWIILLLTAMLLLAACAKVADAPEAANTPESGGDTKMTLTLVEKNWNGWSEKQPEPIVRTFVNVSAGSVIYDSFYYGTIQVDEVTADSICLSLNNSALVEPNENGTINLTADPITSFTIARGEEKELVSKELDGGLCLVFRIDETDGSAPDAESEQTPAPTAEAIVIPKDQRGVELALKAETWGDCICVIPETFSVTEATETELVAKAEDDTETGLIEVRYALVPYEERWAFEAALQDPDTFEKENRHEITAGCSGTCLYHRDSIVCFASTLYLENKVCMVVGKALSEKGIDEFDSTVRRFVAIDARRKADAMGEGINPFFTCTGTEYGEFPLVLKVDREAQLLAFLRENRDLLERAAAELLEHPQMRILSGKASMLNEAGTQYEPIDAAMLSDDLRALLRLSEDGIVSRASVHAPEPLFTEDASPYVIIEFPRAIDTTYDDPGILYNYSLVYTTNTPDQIGEYYDHFLTPIEGNWYLALSELAY